MTLPVWWGRLVFGGFARIGRVVLNQAGGMVDCVLNRLGLGFGGRNCSGRVVLSVEGVVVTHFSWSRLSA